MVLGLDFKSEPKMESLRQIGFYSGKLRIGEPFKQEIYVMNS